MNELINRLNIAASVVNTDINEQTVIALKTELEALALQIAEALNEANERAQNAEHAIGSYRATLQDIRDMARRADTRNEDDDRLEIIRLNDLLGSVQFKALNALKDNQGENIRRELRLLENAVSQFEQRMQSDGGWRYGGEPLPDRVTRIVDFYTRMAARSVEKATEMKVALIAWLRGASINAQAVSFAATHREKDARLRGLIEVIEHAIGELNKSDIVTSATQWDGNVDSWARSDFPTRQLVREIQDLQAEVNRLRSLAGERNTKQSLQSDDLF